MKYLLTILLVGTLFISCKKDSAISKPSEVTSLNIINAIPGSSGLVPVINNQLSYKDAASSSGTIGYGIYSFYYYSLSFQGGDVHLTVAPLSDTAHPVYDNSSLHLPAQSLHTLFFTGTLSKPESVLTNDTLPYHSISDSVTSIRFINLLVGSSPVSVNLVGNANGSEVSSLAYKSITGFKSYAATAAISSYQFEFRNASTGALIKSYTLANVNLASTSVINTVRFRDLTMVLYGNADGSGGFTPSVFYYYPYFSW